jgi:hypothetical protein
MSILHRFRPVLLFVLAAFQCSASEGVYPDGTVLGPLFQQQVTRRLDVPESEQRFYGELLAYLVPDLPSQYILLVDKNPLVQAAMIYWKSPGGGFHFIGASPVSTGKPVGFDHFETPTGIFAHTLDNPDFRAEGTFNENHIRGYGLKGMRVYDFGWQQAKKGWGRRNESTMRLQMHATDPDRLELRLGTIQSKGCIRIHATLNRFIDRYGILDADYDKALAEGKTLWMLRPDREPTPWSGRYLVIVDSIRAQRPVWIARAAIAIK